MRESGSGTRRTMERYFTDHGVALRAGMELASNETIKQAVMAGLGLGFLSLHTIGLELASNRLRVLDVAGLPVRRRWNLCARQTACSLQRPWPFASSYYKMARNCSWKVCWARARDRQMAHQLSRMLQQGGADDHQPDPGAYTRESHHVRDVVALEGHHRP